MAEWAYRSHWGGHRGRRGKEEVAHRQWCGISVKCSSSVGLAGREADKECRRGMVNVFYPRKWGIMLKIEAENVSCRGEKKVTMVIKEYMQDSFCCMMCLS